MKTPNGLTFLLDIGSYPFPVMFIKSSAALILRFILNWCTRMCINTLKLRFASALYLKIKKFLTKRILKYIQITNKTVILSLSLQMRLGLVVTLPLIFLRVGLFFRVHFCILVVKALLNISTNVYQEECYSSFNTHWKYSGACCHNAITQPVLGFSDQLKPKVKSYLIQCYIQIVL